MQFFGAEEYRFREKIRRKKEKKSSGIVPDKGFCPQFFTRNIYRFW
jgi:hypothetical protein